MVLKSEYRTDHWAVKDQLALLWTLAKPFLEKCPHRIWSQRRQRSRIGTISWAVKRCNQWLNNWTCGWLLRGGRSPESLGFIFQTPCISSPNFTTIHPAFVETFPRCINLSMMSEEKSGDHQSPSRVSTKSNGNPSDACRDALTKWTKQDFHFTAVFFSKWWRACC